MAQVGEAAGVSHGGLRAGAAAVEGRGRDRDGEGRGQGGKIFAGLGDFARQPGEDFSSVKVAWTGARGKSRLAPGSDRCRRLARGLKCVIRRPAKYVSLTSLITSSAKEARPMDQPEWISRAKPAEAVS